MRSIKIRGGVATAVATLGLLAFWVPGASAWHGHFRATELNGASGELSFLVVAQPGYPPIVTHLHFGGGRCGFVASKPMTVRRGKDAVRAASGVTEFETLGGGDDDVRLFLDLTPHDGHVTARGHIEYMNVRCTERVAFTATAGAIGLP